MWASFTSVPDDSVGTGEQQNKAEIYLLTLDEIANAKFATLHCGLVLIC
jgi:hypothetical protein